MLTDVTNMLSKAREKLSDFVDGIIDQPPTTPQPSKSASEILKQYELFNYNDGNIDETHVYFENAVTAMMEYASQFQQPQQQKSGEVDSKCMHCNKYFDSSLSVCCDCFFNDPQNHSNLLAWLLDKNDGEHVLLNQEAVDLIERALKQPTSPPPSESMEHKAEDKLLRQEAGSVLVKNCINIPGSDAVVINKYWKEITNSMIEFAQQQTHTQYKAIVWPDEEWKRERSEELANEMFKDDRFADIKIHSGMYELEKELRTRMNEVGVVDLVELLKFTNENFHPIGPFKNAQFMSRFSQEKFTYDQVIKEYLSQQTK